MQSQKVKFLYTDGYGWEYVQGEDEDAGWISKDVVRTAKSNGIVYFINLQIAG